jgi:hypothetical protein
MSTKGVNGSRGFDEPTRALVEQLNAAVKETAEQLAKRGKAAGARFLVATEQSRIAEEALVRIAKIAPGPYLATREALESITAAFRTLPELGAREIREFKAARDLIDESHARFDEVVSVRRGREQVRVLESSVGTLAGAGLTPTGSIGLRARSREALNGRAQQIAVLWDSMQSLLAYSSKLDPSVQPALSRGEIEAFLRKVLASPVMRGGKATTETWGQALCGFARSIREVSAGKLPVSSLIRADLFREAGVDLERPLPELLEAMTGSLPRRLTSDTQAQIWALEDYINRPDLPRSVGAGVGRVLAELRAGREPVSDGVMRDVAVALHDAGRDPYEVADRMKDVVGPLDGISESPAVLDGRARSPVGVRRQAAEDLQRVARRLEGSSDADRSTTFRTWLPELEGAGGISPLGSFASALRQVIGLSADGHTVLDLARES